MDNTERVNMEESLFFKVIEELRSGLPNEALNKQLMQVVEAVKASGKKGSISIKLTITPAVKDNADQVVITDEINAVLPKIRGKDTKNESGDSLFFTTISNRLQRMDPRQGNLDISTGEIVRHLKGVDLNG
jgi:hypothetical protein